MMNFVWLFVSLTVLTVVAKILWKKVFGRRSPNPFKFVDGIAPRPFEVDRKVRKKVLKKAFRPELVPKNLDAIVIGSGIGGLVCAGLLSRAGKKVLVLEQHDRVGGCTHTYKSKGCEYDVGIHYVGNMEPGSMNRCLIDLITDSQLEWVEIDDNFDTVVIDKPGFPIKNICCKKGLKEFENLLYAEFPEEKKAIQRFIELLSISRSVTTVFVVLKILPKALLRLFVFLGLQRIFLKNYEYVTRKSLQEILDELTDNKVLKTVFQYPFGDYGVTPRESCFLMHAMLINHLFRRGGFYPKGGASEIAYQIIPGIERSGGVVLTQACVKEILTESGAAYAIRLTTANSHEHTIHAPVIISAAGLFNTFKSMLPCDVSNKYAVMKDVDWIKPGMSCLQIMVGLNGTKEELNVSGRNYWIFSSDDPGRATDKYLSLSREEAVNKPAPLLFVSFPSAKDPTWNERYPGKSTCIVITLSSLSWFEEWKDTKTKKRGAVYDSLKNTFINQAWSQVLNRFPQLKDKVDHIEGGSPLSHVHYLNSMHGEIYGVHHNKERFCIERAIELRPETNISNLFLTGQDVFTCGILGGAFGGLLSASTVLDRYLLLDWINAVKEIRKKK